jgi:galactokinase/galacturonokinase
VTLRFLISTDGAVNLDSLNFPEHVSFDLGNIGDKQGNWGDYAKGAAFALSQKYQLRNGIKGVVRGTLPVGGLSSSAAVVLCYLNALCLANDITLTPSELIKTALFAENGYVGINVGKLDQSCEVLCKRQHLLALDTRDDSYTLIPAPDTLGRFEIAIFYSGVSRVLGSGYNTRVDEANSAHTASRLFLVWSTACTRIPGSGMSLLWCMKSTGTGFLWYLPRGHSTTIRRWTGWRRV